MGSCYDGEDVMVKIIADIGINHNGDMSIVKKLIDVCSIAGVDYVKFQKRTPDLCVPEHQKKEIRETPWGEISYIEYKHKIELSKSDYYEIDDYCKLKNIKWFASIWDEESAKFMNEFCNLAKIPSAMVTNLSLLQEGKKLFNDLILSTGMSTEEEISIAVNVAEPKVIMHCNSSYPANIKDLNLSYLNWLKEKYPKISIGYSGHEFGLVTTFASVAMGATWIERHVTLNRMMWGSDQLSSVEPEGIFKLVRGIRDIESAMGKKEPRKIYDCELPKRNSLRK